MKKLISAVLIVVLALGLVACAAEAPPVEESVAPTESEESVAPAESPEEPEESGLISVGFAQVGHESDWRMASTTSAQEALSEANGFDLSFVDCDNDSAAQLEAVRQFIQDDVDYIVIAPIVSTGWDTVLTEAEDAGIPVIVLDRTIEDSDKYATWIGSEFMNEGLAAGAWLKDYAALKEIAELNILVLEGTTGSSAQIGRTDGFKKYADDNGWNILDSQSGNFDQAGGQEVMESFCKSYEGKFNVVVAQNDNMAFGAMDAMDAAGVTYGVGNDVILISWDAVQAALQMVLDGKINSDFCCYPLQGPTLAATIQKLQAGETVADKTFMIEPWYVAEDVLKTITYTNSIGEEVTEDLIVVTEDIVASQPY